MKLGNQSKLQKRREIQEESRNYENKPVEMLEIKPSIIK
jgi:hypothetical protein